MRTVRTRRRAVFRASATVTTAVTTVALAVGAAPAAFADAPQETVNRVVTGDDGTLTVQLTGDTRPLWLQVTVRSSAAADAATLYTTDDTVESAAQGVTAEPVRLPAGTAYGDYPVDVDFRLPGGTVQHWSAAEHGAAGLLDYRLHAAVTGATFDRTATDYDHRTATLTGTVESLDPATGQEAPAPAGTHVRVGWSTFDGHRSTRHTAPVTTGEAGAFRLPVVPGGVLSDGTAAVEDPAADTTPAAAVTLPSVGVTKTQYRISAAQSRPLVHKGLKFTVSGSVQRLTAAGWKPLAGAPVVTATSTPDFYDNVTGVIGSGTSAANGTFTTTVTATRTLSHYTFVRPTPYLGFAYDSDTVHVPTAGSFSHTAISLDRYGLIKATGRLHGDCGYQNLYLQFSPNGKTGWLNITHVTTEYPDGGYCAYAVSGYGAWDGHYRVYHPESQQLLAVAGPEHRLKRTRTAVTVKMTPSRPRLNAKLTATGLVTQLTAKGWKPYAKAHIVLVYKPKGDTQWYWVVKGYTNAAGRFTLATKAWGDGTWAAYLDANSSHYYSETKDVYVDVR